MSTSVSLFLLIIFHFSWHHRLKYTEIESQFLAQRWQESGNKRTSGPLTQPLGAGKKWLGNTWLGLGSSWRNTGKQAGDTATWGDWTVLLAGKTHLWLKLLLWVSLVLCNLITAGNTAGKHNTWHYWKLLPIAVHNQLWFLYSTAD